MDFYHHLRHPKLYEIVHGKFEQCGCHAHHKVSKPIYLPRGIDSSHTHHIACKPHIEFGISETAFGFRHHYECSCTYTTSQLICTNGKLLTLRMSNFISKSYVEFYHSQCANLCSRCITSISFSISTGTSLVGCLPLLAASLRICSLAMRSRLPATSVILVGMIQVRWRAILEVSILSYQRSTASRSSQCRTPLTFSAMHSIDLLKWSQGFSCRGSLVFRSDMNYFHSISRAVAQSAWMSVRLC